MRLIQRVSPRKIVDIELAAENLLHVFQPDVMQRAGIFDVESFFEFELQKDTNIEPICADLPKGIDGYTDSVGMKCFISEELWGCDKRDDVQRRRLRSTMAHEIGHCYLHVPEARRNREMPQIFGKNDRSSFDLYDSNDLEAFEDPEWQAWRFASALLMPQDCFRRAVEHDWTVQHLRDGFDVNRAYILKRIRELKISKQVRNG